MCVSDVSNQVVFAQILRILQHLLVFAAILWRFCFGIGALKTKGHGIGACALKFY